MTDKENIQNPENTYNDGNVPELNLPGKADFPSGKNRYGDEPIGDPGNNDTNPSGESNLVWVTPPVLLADSEGAAANAMGGA